MTNSSSRNSYSGLLESLSKEQVNLVSTTDPDCLVEGQQQTLSFDEKSSIYTVLNAIPSGIMVILAAIYAVFFVKSLSPFWFNPSWTTDDAMQQHFPFHKVLEPELFRDDLITRAMEGYLTPAHNLAMTFFTFITGTPLMAGHWVFLLQLCIAGGFLIGASRHYGGIMAATASITWLLHTRHTIQRMSDGLVRGWSVPVFCSFFYFAAKANHVGMLFALLVGALVHPPATFIVGLAYGFFLLIECLTKLSKGMDKPFKNILLALLTAPLVALTSYLVVSMPPEIGQMASYEEALTRPEFFNPGGRFPFVPLQSVEKDFRIFGFQAFLSQWVKHGKFGEVPIEFLIMASAVIFTVGVGLLSFRMKKTFIPKEAWIFLVALLITYQCSRMFAFKLYVPNRHLQIPMALFFIFGLSVGTSILGKAVWEKYFGQFGKRTTNWGSLFAVFALASFVFYGSGLGLYGRANYNWHTGSRGEVFKWVANNTPVNAVIAGHPTFLDPIQLFGKRIGYATTETAHPFYRGYYDIIASRLERSLRAHYAHNLSELYDLTEPVGINYFIFERKRFYPKELKTASYFKPFDGLVKELTSGNASMYAYRELPQEIDLEKAPYMVFRDAYSVVIDIAKLGQYLNWNSSSEYRHK